MFQRDYIMRMIEQLTVVMARYMRLKAQERDRETLLQLEDFYSKLLLPSSPLLLLMSERELLGLLSVNGEPDLDKMVGLAVLFKEEGRVYEDLGEYKESGPRLLRSLQLMLEAESRGAHVPGVDGPTVVDELRELLRTYRIPAETLERLALHYEGQAAYGRAEDAWFELLELPGLAGLPGGRLYPQETLRFYDRLEALPDEALEAGNLPRVEIEDAKNQILSIMEGM